MSVWIKASRKLSWKLQSEKYQHITSAKILFQNFRKELQYIYSVSSDNKIRSKYLKFNYLTNV